MTGKKILIITGEINSGKSSIAEKIYRTLKVYEKEVSGVLTPGTFSGNSKSGYNAIEISGRNTFKLAVNGLSENFKLKLGRYYFDEDVFSKMNASLIQSTYSDVILFDEIGHLELMGKGLYPSFKFCLEKSKAKLILVIRNTLLNDIIHKFNIDRNNVEIISPYPK